jgi:predicted O-methyltransferase YrrM
MEKYIMIVILVLLAVTSGIYFSKYKKYKSWKDNKFFIPQTSLTEISPIFVTNEFGPTLMSEVSFMGRGDLSVPGGTSDTEAWILSVLAKSATNMFELGTCTGKTSYLMAKNSKSDAKVYTLTLPPEEIVKYAESSKDDQVATTNAKNESAFTKFFYSGTSVEDKIIQIFCDSKKFDESKFLNFFDLIFIDGSHAYSYIKSDSEKCMKMLNKNGIILWHDYSGINKNSKDVYKYLNELSGDFRLYHIKETSFVMYKNN